MTANNAFQPTDSPRFARLVRPLNTGVDMTSAVKGGAVFEFFVGYIADVIEVR